MTQFNWKTNACKVCHQPGKYVSCPARKYVAQRCGKTFVYHCRTHTCPFMPSTEQAEKDVKRIITEHPDATPAQIQSSVILSRMRKHCDWSEVDKAAASVSDKKWISNTKQEIKKSNEPRGHDFEAVAHFKEYADEHDPYCVYKVKYNTGEANGQSYVFKTSKLKVKIAINMDQSKEHFLSREFCHFDSKVKRCKGFVTLSASVYHPLLQKLIPLAVMECGAENTSNISLFWSTFNKVLRKESDDANYVFNQRGWITDMAGANIEGLKKVYGTAATERIKTCEFHFKDCRNKQAHKLDENSRSHFKRLCQALIQAESQTRYEAAKENLLDFIAQDNNHKFLQSWFEWWDRRRALIFPAFQNEQSRSKMNMAETTHASWVKRDRENLSLLDVAHADVSNNLQLELAYKNFQHGTGQGGKGPSVQVQQSKEHALQINRAHNLGRELIREDLTDSDIVGNYASPKVVSNPHDKHNASVKTVPHWSQGKRNGRFRLTRSKVFLNRLQKVNEEKSSIKVRDSSTTGKTKCFTLVMNSSSMYRVRIGRKHFCQCMDFAKNGQNELCKHIIWVLLHVCKVPQESELLHQIFLTEAESYEILSNTPAHIPEDLRYVAGKKTQNRQDIVKNLLMNNDRNVKPKIWILKKKEKQRGTTPRCRELL